MGSVEMLTGGFCRFEVGRLEEGTMGGSLFLPEEGHTLETIRAAGYGPCGKQCSYPLLRCTPNCHEMDCDRVWGERRNEAGLSLPKGKTERLF